MIKRLRRRYLITNMSLLSGTLLVSLSVLFGVLYHAEVSSSYTVMQEMMKTANEAEPPPEEEKAEPTSNYDEPQLELLSNAVTNSQYEPDNYSWPYYPYPWWPGWPVWPPAWPEPPGGWGELPENWWELPPGWWTHPEDFINQPKEEDPAQTTQPPDDLPLIPPDDPPLIPPDDPPLIPPDDPQPDPNDNDNDPSSFGPRPTTSTTTVTTTATRATTTTSATRATTTTKTVTSRTSPKTTSSSRRKTTTTTVTVTIPNPRHDPHNGPPGNGGEHNPPPETMIGRMDNDPNRPQLETHTTAVQTTEPPSQDNPNSVTTVIPYTEPKKSETAPSVPYIPNPPGGGRTPGNTTGQSAKVSPIVPLEEGNYIPDAFIAELDSAGNIESYAGNDQRATDGEHFNIVHQAIGEVKRRSMSSGTIKINETPYRFLYEPDESGHYRLILLDRTVELSTLRRLIFIFILITTIGLMTVFLISLKLANWTVKPISVAWEKQKQFVADASHELKTPLAVIAANTEVILSNPSESVSGQSKWLSYIQSETMRMSKLITNLLSVARMDSGKPKSTNTDTLSLSDAVSNICLVFEPIIYENGKSLTTSIERDVNILTEEDNIKQLLSILLDNAVLHSVPGAMITVSLTKESHDKIRLAVSNTAKDIPEEQLVHLFDRFYRVDTEGSPNGSGLGLSIARSIVRQMGGNASITSENNLFTFIAELSAS